jgi:hypothetical protein
VSQQRTLSTNLQEDRMPKLKTAALAALAVAMFAVLAGPAAARDRNHDRIPDRWEKRHHLSLNVNQARRDQDHDGLRNLAEFKAGDNPRDADSDNNGIKDGSEHAGTIASFTNGTLTINLFGGGTIAGLVTDATRLECEGTAHASDHGGDGGNSGPGSSGDDNPSGSDDQGDDNGADDQNADQGDDNGNDASCGTAALTAGREVDEAELRLSNGTATFKEVKLAP